MFELNEAQQSIAATLADTAFFNHIRTKLFHGGLNQAQVDGINALVLAGVQNGLTLQQHAYVLATAYHETGIVKRLPDGRRVLEHTMQPVREMDKGAGRKYGTWLTNSQGVKYCLKNGSGSTVYTQDECPHLFYGRGHVQLTWFDNYLRATRKLNALLPETEQVDLIADPDLALRTDISAKIIVLGMKEGWFTGKCLSDYINDNRDDYKAARRIVNGTDKAEQIAQYARIFESALNAT